MTENATPNPKPRSTAPLMAPNMQSQVQQTINEHPEINTMDEEARGEIIDITDWRVNGGIDRPWGRKARVNSINDPQLNTDGMTYLRPDGLFEIYDCISGTDGQSSWEGYGPYMQGENGYWWPPQPVKDQVEPPAPAEDLTPRVEALEEQVKILQGQVTALEQTLQQSFHAHGPIDVPIVVESLTRMRAKGDIDVEVKIGEAVPPISSGEEFTFVDLALLKKILNRPEES